MKQLIWIVIAVALVGCSSKKDDGAKQGAAAGGGGGGAAMSCAEAAGKAVSSLGAGPEASGIREKLTTILTTRCTEDKWPAEVIQCYAAVTGMQGMTACRNKLPPELGNKLRGEIIGAMAGAGGGMRPPMGHPGGGPAAPAAGDSAAAPAADGSAAAPAGGSASP